MIQNSITSAPNPGGFWPQLTRHLPTGKNTVFGAGALLTLAVAVLLTWMFTAGPWSDGDSFPSGISTRSEYDGRSAPAVEPSPGDFGSAGSMTVAVTNDSTAGMDMEEREFKASGGAGTATLGAYGERQIISQGSMSLEVTDVATAASQVWAIAEGASGFVEQLSSYGANEFQESTLTIRVPQVEFFSVFMQIKALGEVRSENAGSEDVSEQFIDLETHLKNAQRKEQSLLSLLDRAELISEVLIIEQELTRVRSEMERIQGQLNFLERRVDLATITVFLNIPEPDDGQAPSGSLNVATSDVTVSVAAIKTLTGQVEGEVDRVFTSIQDGRERANMTVKVFAKDFSLLVAAVEDQGGLVSKEIQEGRAGDTIAEKPESRLAITFNEKESSNLGRDLAIYTPIGGIAMVIVLGGLLLAAYRMGARSED